MCDCINLVDDQLAKYNTQLNYTMTFDGMPPRARVETIKRKPSRSPNEPYTVTASYCPFCGIEYKEADND